MRPYFWLRYGMIRVIAIKSNERRRDVRRNINLGRAANEGHITFVDISSSGIGAKGLSKGGALGNDEEGYQVEILPLDHGKREFTGFVLGQVAEFNVYKDKSQILSILVKIVRYDKLEDRIGARFLNIGDEQFSIIERLVTGRSIKPAALSQSEKTAARRRHLLR